MAVESLKQIEDIYIKFYQKVKSKHIWKQLRSYHIAYGSRTETPRQKPPGHKPQDKNPLDKNSPCQKNPGQKPPRQKFFSEIL